MKAGDILVCKKDFIDGDDSAIWCSKNKSYTILCREYTKSFYIIDDEGDENYYILDEDILNKYFYTEKEIRKLKLDKLNEIRI